MRLVRKFFEKLSNPLIFNVKTQEIRCSKNVQNNVTRMFQALISGPNRGPINVLSMCVHYQVFWMKQGEFGKDVETAHALEFEWN